MAIHACTICLACATSHNSILMHVRMCITIHCILQFICAQDWDIAFLQELTSEEVINTLTNKLIENRCVTMQHYAII